MRLGVKNILKILKGSIVPPAEAIESINDKMWKYYREFKWKTLSNRWASREHCGGLSLLLPYNYHNRVTDDGTCISWQSKASEKTYSCLTVNICPSYGGDCNFLLSCETVPEFTKDLIRLFDTLRSKDTESVNKQFAALQSMLVLIASFIESVYWQSHFEYIDSYL
jgi:hypothetical protein